MATTAVSRLKAPLRDLVTADRMGRPLPPSLTPEDVKALVEVVREGPTVSGVVRTDRAVQAIAAGAQTDVAVRALGEILGADAMGSTERVVAARELGTIATPEAEAALVRAVVAEHPRVQQAVFDALGRIGGPEALRHLNRPNEPEDAAARRQLALARALIAHRHGVEGPFLGDPQPGDRTSLSSAETTTVELRAAPREDASGPEQFAGGTYGIDGAEKAYEMKCGGNVWTLLLNRELDPQASAEDAVFARPWIAAVLARWLRDGRAAVVQQVVLVRPVRNGARVDVVRTDGEVLYTGSARPDGPPIAFALDHVDRPGAAAAHVEGRLDRDGLMFTAAVASSRRRQGRTVQSALPS